MGTKRSVDRLRDGMERLARGVEHAARAAADSGAEGTNVNVAHRENVVVRTNVGRSGSASAASARQSAPIVQDGEKQ